MPCLSTENLQKNSFSQKVYTVRRGINYLCFFRRRRRQYDRKEVTTVKKFPYPPEERPEEAQLLQDPLMNSSSAGDCTGLIPAISGEEEYESYAELYGFLPPENKGEK